MRTVLALILIGGGGWLMYTVVTGNLSNQGQDTFGSSTRQKPPVTGTAYGNKNTAIPQ